MKSFDQAVQTYESFGFIQREMAAWLAEWLPSHRVGTAVEAGAGTGFFTRYLLPWKGRLVATDAAPAMTERGKSLWPGIDWQVALADRLPDVSPQWIFSSSFLQWAKEPERVLRHWKGRLDSGGRALAGFFVAPTLPELHQVLPGCAPLTWRTPAEWEEHLQRAGLKLLRSEAVERVFLFKSSLDLLRTLHRTGTVPSSQTPACRLRRALREYDSRFANEHGVRSTWTFYRLESEA